jgi:geranylgeranyl diphosphate synthase type I
VLDPQAPASAAFRAAVSVAIADFLDGQQTVLAEMGRELAPVHDLAVTLLSGGKRLRPAFSVWGYVAARGLPAEQDLPPLLAAAASLEMLHVSALVHDDVMDSSDLRRGQPAAHRQFETLHRQSGWVGDAAGFGRSGAILLGDLLLMWSVQMLQRCGLPAATLAPALVILDAMRTEVTCGQFLDVVAQARPLAPRPEVATAGPADLAAAVALDEALRVVEYKSARYTVQRPCQMGAALGGADERLQRALGAYGSPIGRAFQLRDDLLGVFGDPAVTGKPTGDDLREGKRTVLVAHAYAHSDAAARQLLVHRLGDPDLDPVGVAALQQVITESGARDACEAMISAGHEQAMAALAAAEVTDEGRTALTALADAAVHRIF